MKTINICFVTDENYAAYTGTCIYSIIQNATSDSVFSFYIFDNHISDRTKQQLQNLVSAPSSLVFVNVSSKLNELKQLEQTIPHISKTSYLKFFIADLLPQIDKIIYLDGDLIVTDSMHKLWEIDLQENLLAAVEDVGYSYWNQHNPELKLKFKCMNSGVMILNCKLWREQKLSEQLLACAKQHDKVGFGQDQPVLNFVCKDKVLFLPFPWNAQDTFFRDEIEIENRPDIAACHEAKNHPKIIHFTYVKKPWNYPFMRQADIFWKYYAASSLCPKALFSKYKALLPLISTPDIAKKLRECEIDHIRGRAFKFLIVIAFLYINGKKHFLISFRDFITICI